MLELIKLSVYPKKELICVINCGLKALCTQVNIANDKAYRLQLATEEIFIYAVHTVQKATIHSMITARFSYDSCGFQIVIEYTGKPGPLDRHLKNGSLHNIKVKSFEALGLCLASNILDSLTTQYWANHGITCYTLSLNFAKQKKACLDW